MRRRRIAPVLAIGLTGVVVFVFTFYIKGTIGNAGSAIPVIGAVENGPIAVLVAAEIAYEAHGIVDIVHIHAGICITADHGSEIGRIAEEHEGGAPKTHLQEVIVLLNCPADSHD